MARVSRKAKFPVNKSLTNEVDFAYSHKTALYIRLSNEEAEGDATEKIENQKKLLIEYIREKEEHQLVGIYCDNGWTGRNFNRPEWIRLMEDVKRGKVTCIIVKDLSRLGRNYIEAGDYLEKVFPFLGVRFIAISDGYDSEDKNTNLEQIMLPLKNIINDTYAKDLSKKIRSARKIQRQKGEFTGSVVPYGYKRDTNRKGHLQIDEKTAPVVRMIFQWIADGYSYSKVAEELNCLQIMSPRKGMWSYQFIRMLVSKRVYIGDLIQGLQCAAGNDVIEIRNAHEAIIEKELFYKVQECRQRIQNAVPDRKGCGPAGQEEYIFKGLLIAGYNMKKMYKVHYYINNGKDMVKAYKSVKSFREDGTAYHLIQIKEETVIHCVEKILFKYLKVLDVLSEYLETDKVQKYYEKKLRQADKEIEGLKKLLCKAREFLADIYTDMNEGVIKPKDYILYRGKYLIDEKTIEKEIAEKEKARNALSETLLMENPYIKQLEKFRSDPVVTRELIHLLIDKIIVNSSTNIEIVFQFKDEFEELQKLFPINQRRVACE